MLSIDTSGYHLIIKDMRLHQQKSSISLCKKIYREQFTILGLRLMLSVQTKSQIGTEPTTISLTVFNKKVV